MYRLGCAFDIHVDRQVYRCMHVRAYVGAVRLFDCLFVNRAALGALCLGPGTLSGATQLEPRRVPKDFQEDRPLSPRGPRGPRQWNRPPGQPCLELDESEASHNLLAVSAGPPYEPP